jgi:hypothetical protein
MEGAGKQVLLEMTSENARLQRLAAYLEELLPVLEVRMARKKHGKNQRPHTAPVRRVAPPP